MVFAAAISESLTHYKSRSELVGISNGPPWQASLSRPSAATPGHFHQQQYLQPSAKPKAVTNTRLHMRANNSHISLSLGTSTFFYEKNLA